MEDEDSGVALELTATIIAAYVSNNSLPMAELPGLILSVHSVLNTLSGSPVRAAEPPRPAVAISKSIADDYIVCLEDGRKFKSLKRHLRVSFGMTPEQYRAKWGLPRDYPMVAPAYAEKRSNLARNMGLGQQRRGKGKK